MDFSVYDRIIVKDFEHIREYMDWIVDKYNGNRTEAMKQMAMQNLPFDKGVIDLEYEDMRVFFEKIDEQIVRMSLYDEVGDDAMKILSFDLNFMYMLSDNIVFNKSIKKETAAFLLKAAQNDKVIERVIGIFAILVYTSNNRTEYVENKEIEVNSITKKEAKRQANEKNRPLSLIRKVYVFSKGELPKIIKHSSPSYEFGVKGHWRNYKDGRKVWINSYNKCVGKGDCRHKTYVV